MGCFGTESVEKVACIDYSTLTNEKIGCELKAHVQRQNEQWQKLTRLKCMNQQDLDESARLRKSLQQGMCAASIQRMYGCLYGTQPSPSVLAVALQIMETALLKIRQMQDKYLTCFSAACFIIACKFLEDDHEVALRSMISLHRRQWSASDLKRMEMRVMQVVGWSVPRTTYLDFVPALRHLLALNEMRVEEEELVYKMADLLLASQQAANVKPAALAFTLLLYCPGLEPCPTIPPEILASIQDMCQFGEEEVQQISQLLRTKLHSKTFTFPTQKCPFDYRIHTINEATEESDFEDSLSQFDEMETEAVGRFLRDSADDVTDSILLKTVELDAVLESDSVALSFNLATSSVPCVHVPAHVDCNVLDEVARDDCSVAKIPHHTTCIDRLDKSKSQFPYCQTVGSKSEWKTAITSINRSSSEVSASKHNSHNISDKVDRAIVSLLVDDLGKQLSQIHQQQIYHEADKQRIREQQADEDRFWRAE